MEQLLVLIIIIGPFLVGIYIGNIAYKSVSESYGKLAGNIAALFVMGVVTYGIYFFLGLFGLAQFLDSVNSG